MSENRHICFSAYEQALQLAESGAGKSGVLAAMGMLGYALNDKDGAKAMLLKRWDISISNLSIPGQIDNWLILHLIKSITKYWLTQ